jgi:hypothetical protein
VSSRRAATVRCRRVRPGGRSRAVRTNRAASSQGVAAGIETLLEIPVRRVGHAPRPPGAGASGQASSARRLPSRRGRRTCRRRRCSGRWRRCCRCFGRWRRCCRCFGRWRGAVAEPGARRACHQGPDRSACGLGDRWRGGGGVAGWVRRGGCAGQGRGEDRAERGTDDSGRDDRQGAPAPPPVGYVFAGRWLRGDLCGVLVVVHGGSPVWRSAKSWSQRRWPVILNPG